MMVTTEVKQEARWSFADLTPVKTQYLTHGYHRYPAKFIPQLVRQLIEEYSKPRDRICDPFGGCGTTLVEAKLARRASFGFDINPVAVLITRAKTVSIQPSDLSARFANLCEDLESTGIARPQITRDRLAFNRLLYWFGETNLEQLLSLKNRLEQEDSSPIRRFFLCALSHVLKNCSYWLTTSTKPQKDYHKAPKSPVKAFRAHASRMVEQNRAFFEEIAKRNLHELPTIMRKADAKKLPLPDGCMDLVITSPPYSTSYDYPDIHQLSALLFGFCTSLSAFRQGFIGSKNDSHHRDRSLVSAKALETVRNLNLADARLAKAVYNYFVDMSYVYYEMHRILQTGKRACIVIGDTELRGVSIPNAELTIDQMCEAGFVLERTIKRPVPNRVLAPYRDKNDGRFTSPSNPAARKVYSHEYILVLRKK